MNEMMQLFNKYHNEGNEPQKMKIEVVYASADNSEVECLEFVRRQSKPWASFSWNDPRILEI